MNAILETLRDIAANGVYDKEEGICVNFVWRAKKLGYNLSYDTLEKYFLTWDKFSGDERYPVPHPNMDALDAYQDLDELWDIDTEYGRNRWDLLEHLIRSIENEG